MNRLALAKARDIHNFIAARLDGMRGRDAARTCAGASGQAQEPLQVEGAGIGAVDQQVLPDTVRAGGPFREKQGHSGGVDLSIDIDPVSMM